VEEPILFLNSSFIINELVVFNNGQIELKYIQSIKDSDLSDESDLNGDRIFSLLEGHCIQIKNSIAVFTDIPNDDTARYFAYKYHIIGRYIVTTNNNWILMTQGGVCRSPNAFFSPEQIPTRGMKVVLLMVAVNLLTLLFGFFCCRHGENDKRRLPAVVG